MIDPHAPSRRRPDHATGPANGRLLAIDSSTERAGVALFDGDTIAEISWIAGRSQTTSLLGEIDHLLRLNGLGLSDVAAVAVATGPGAFSALRVGAGTAKGLALARDLPVIGIPTLDIAAAPFRWPGRATIAVVAAGRGRLVWADYGARDGTWSQTAPPVNGTPAELRDACLAVPGEVLVTGEISEEFARELSHLPGVTVPPTPDRARRPGALAGLAWPRWLRRDTDDLATLEPLYLHGR